MKHAAAFVLLLTIAGSPATTLVCVGLCAPDATPVSGSCHHHRSGAGAAISNTDDTCATLLVATPYLKEDIQQTRTAMPASAPYVLAGAPGEAQLVLVPEVASMLPHRPASPLVLRL